MHLSLMMLGAIAMACFVASLLFLRSWRETRDRFFLFFSLAFCVEGVGRIVLGLQRYSDEQEPFFYLIRLLSFVIILVAIIDKNFFRKQKLPK
jgi:hypothetical protein